MLLVIASFLLVYQYLLHDLASDVMSLFPFPASSLHYAYVLLTVLIKNERLEPLLVLIFEIQ